MLGVSYNTAKTRIKTLYAKLQVSNRNELILKALNLKLIDSRNIKPKFRKRFLSHEADRQAVLLEPLTAEEIKFRQAIQFLLVPLFPFSPSLK